MMLWTWICWWLILDINLLLDGANLEWIGGGSTKLWSDKDNWLTGIAPISTDDMFFPENSGQIYFDRDMVVRNLEVGGGQTSGGVQFIAQNTSCPSGWSPYIIGLTGTKCLKLIRQATDFYSAEQQCILMGRGAPEARLVQISSHDELNMVKRICRAANTMTNTSGPTVDGCWIGLHMGPNVVKDPVTTNRKSYFTWTSGNNEAQGPGHPGSTPTSLGTLVTAFRDWRRFEPSNHTVSEGEYDLSGEDCVEILPWDEDPMVMAEGSFNDNGCALHKPYVCQLGAVTRQFRIVASTVLIYDGGMIGGELVVNDHATITKFNATHGAVVTLTGSESRTPSSVKLYLHLQMGASLHVKSELRLSAGALVGEAPSSMVDLPFTHALLYDHTTRTIPFAQNSLGMQPLVRVYATGNISVAGTVKHNESAVINAALDVQTGGRLILTGIGRLRLLQGGNLSAATVVLANPDAALELGGGGAQLFTYDAVDVTLSSQLPVVGETDSANPLGFSYAAEPSGVYRLRVQLAARPTLALSAFTSLLSQAGHSRPVVHSDGTTAMTRCIPYNATNAYIADALGALQLVRGRGNVSVRSYGRALDPSYSYGYTYRVEMDSVPTAALGAGPLRLSLGCYGAACACAESKVLVLPEAAAKVKCGRFADRPLPDGTVSPYLECALPPTITVVPISTLSQLQTVGMGRVVVLGGVHRMPPVATTTLVVVGGTALVANDVITWSSALVGGTGSLALAGVGWAAWDSLNSVGQAEWTTYRGFTPLLAHAPTFSLSLLTFAVFGNGSVFTAAPSSNMTCGAGLWLGGTIGGQSILSISGTMTILTRAVKYLRMGCTLHIPTDAVLRWGGGTVGLSEGANVHLEGQMLVYGNYSNSTDRAGWRDDSLAMGQAELLDLNLVYSSPFFLAQELRDYQGLIHPDETTAQPSAQGTSTAAPTLTPTTPGTVSAQAPWQWNVTDTLVITQSVISFLGSYQAGLQWHGYYDHDLIPSLKGGWYEDPLCGTRCTLHSNITLGPVASILVATNCTDWLPKKGVYHAKDSNGTRHWEYNTTECSSFSVSFSSPLLMTGSAKVVVGAPGNVVLKSGGVCADNATFSLVEGSLELAGGRMDMIKHCAVLGEGVVAVSGGRHELPLTVFPATYVWGGALVWPEWRGAHRNVSFFGGLYLSGTGMVVLEPLATQLSIYKGLTLTGRSTLQCPVIGMALEPAGSDDHLRAPDNANSPHPLTHVSAWDGMYFYGGTLRGRCNFVAYTVLYVGGGNVKQVQEQASLINMGHAEYGLGDVLFRDSSHFYNRGTLQSIQTAALTHLSSVAVNEGAEDPTALFQMMTAGADRPLEATDEARDEPLLATQYHSWDEDLYHLNYSVYVNGLGDSMSFTAPPDTVELDRWDGNGDLRGH